MSLDIRLKNNIKILIVHHYVRLSFITICENDNTYVVFASQEIFFDANNKAIEYGYVNKLLFLQYV